MDSLDSSWTARWQYQALSQSGGLGQLYMAFINGAHVLNEILTDRYWVGVRMHIDIISKILTLY